MASDGHGPSLSSQVGMTTATTTTTTNYLDAVSAVTVPHTRKRSSDGEPLLGSGATQAQASQQRAWNPAALLQPAKSAVNLARANGDDGLRARRAQSTVALGRPEAQVVFQFASRSSSEPAAPSPPETTAARDPGGDARVTQNGMAGMVERISNVQERGLIPQVKRQKVGGQGDGSVFVLENPPQASTSKRGTGMLLQDDQNEPQQKSTASAVRAEAIDLTEEVEEKKRDPGDEEICLGMITANINCHVVPSPKQGHQAVYGPGWFPAVKVVLKRLDGDSTFRVSAYDHTRQTVGALQDVAANCLSQLLDSGAVRTESTIPPRQKRGQEEPGKPTAVTVPINITLYSCYKYARNIGKHLRRFNFELRSPVIASARYLNPHAQQGQAQNAAQVAKPRVDVPTPQAAAAPRTAEEMRSDVVGVFDSVTKDDDMPEADAPATVKTPLLKHQRQGLHFLEAKEQPFGDQIKNEALASFWQERRGIGGNTLYFNLITGQSRPTPPASTRGGVLADMMGLGKTLSILSLVAGSLQAAANWALLTPLQPREPPPRPQKQGLPAQSQALGFTKLLRNSKSTLLVCPLSTVANWEEQIKQHLAPNSLSYHVYHGSGRIKDVDKLAQFDIVITTYGSVSSELGSRSKRKQGQYPLEEIGWFRIVLDEAHMIREYSTLQFKAIYRLQAQRRWAVTGTPVQNRLDDFAALLAFLRVEPFHDRSKFIRYIVEPFKMCDTQIVPKLRLLVDSITLRRLKDKIDLPPRSDEVVKLDFSAEERQIYDLFAKNAKDRVNVLTDNGAQRSLRGQTYIHILRSILRLRLLCAHGKDLLNDEDLSSLQGMTAEMAIDLDGDDDSGGSVLSERQAYDALQLKQETNNDYCAECGKKFGSGDGTGLELENQDDVMGYMNPCFHVICRSCYPQFRAKCLQALDARTSFGPCPDCSTEVPMVFVELRRSKAAVEHDGPAKDRVRATGGKRLGDYSGPHTKTKALVSELLALKAASAEKPTEAPLKSVVFSGWTSHLDLIQRALDGAAITHTRLDGGMTRKARTQAMDTFREDPAIHVMLVSIMAGGLGLNLTAGSNVFVMEPQYNPAAEAQAVDRVHRLGQKRPVRVVRYIMHNSLEEKMVELQKKKVKLATLSMDGKGKPLDKVGAARQQLEDLRSLFK